MVHKCLLLFVVCLSIPGLSTATAAKKKALQVKNNSGVTPAVECGGGWVKEEDGGSFTSPDYPEKYPADRECVYIIEAAPRQCIDLFFDERYSIEPSWDCKFDHIEVRDGAFQFSPIIGRYCGEESPGYVRSSGRYLYIKFVADSELEAIGFSAHYNFTPDPEFQHLAEVPPPPLPVCDFEVSGPEGIIDSSKIGLSNPVLLKDAVDCRWYIRAPPRFRVYVRFLEYEMHNSNDCKRNFVAIYDGSSSVEHLRNKFCSTVANDVMLDTNVGVVRLWADEGSRKSRTKILFTTFHPPPCDDDTFFCHSNMCINTTLVCNGVQNCVYPWDENHCKEKRKPTILETMDSTNLTIIGVSCVLTVIMLVISCIIQIKQPRKKYIIHRDDLDLDPGPLHPDFDPPHYELCTLPRPPSGDPADAAAVMASSDSSEKFQKICRSSSKCIRDHHCGSQHDLSGSRGNLSVHGSRGNLSMHGSRGNLSVHGSRGNLSVRETAIGYADGGGPLMFQHGTPAGPRSILVMKHSYSQDAVNGCELDEDEDDLMLDDDGATSSHHHHLDDGAATNSHHHHVQHHQFPPGSSGMEEDGGYVISNHL